MISWAALFKNISIFNVIDGLLNMYDIKFTSNQPSDTSLFNKLIYIFNIKNNM